MDDRDRLEILHEDMNAKFDAVLEYVKDIPAMKQDLAVLKDDVGEVKSAISVVKHVVSEHSSDIVELKASSHRQ